MKLSIQCSMVDVMTSVARFSLCSLFCSAVMNNSHSDATLHADLFTHFFLS